MEYLSTIPRVMMVTFHVWHEKLIFTSDEVPAVRFNNKIVFFSIVSKGFCEVVDTMLPSV